MHEENDFCTSVSSGDNKKAPDVAVGGLGSDPGRIGWFPPAVTAEALTAKSQSDRLLIQRLVRTQSLDREIDEAAHLR